MTLKMVDQLADNNNTIYAKDFKTAGVQLTWETFVLDEVPLPLFSPILVILTIFNENLNHSRLVLLFF